MSEWYTILSAPDRYGLEIVGTIEFSGGYEFDTIAVFHRPENGNVFYVWDEGCSCPTPFDSKSVSDLVKVSRVADLSRIFDERWTHNDCARNGHELPREQYFAIVGKLRDLGVPA